MKTTVGFVTIGQSPRPDLLSSFKSPDLSILECGALDEYTTEQIKGLTPKNGKDTLVTRLRDGTEVVIGLSQITSKLQDCVDKLNAKAADLIALLCTGTFPEFKSRAPIIRTGELVYGFLGSLKVQHRIGVMVPSEQQLRPIQEDFLKRGFDAVTSAFSPNASLQECVKPFMDEDVSLIVMLCMAYDQLLKAEVAKLTGKPCVLPRSLLAKAIEEMSHVMQ